MVKSIGKSVILGLQRVANNGLNWIETRRQIDSVPYRPIFIVGSPRAGTTLLYQLLVQYFPVGYLSNLHCVFWGAPSWVERAIPGTLTAPAECASRYGRTKGLRAPSECGEYWYRFFSRSPHYATTNSVAPESLQRLRVSVGCLTRAFGGPVLFKNVINTGRLEAIGRALPEALFIEAKRDPVATGISLLEARRRIWGDYSHWWSLEPPDVERLKKLPPHEQVIEQVCEAEKMVVAARKNLGSNRFYTVDYNELCQSPGKQLASIAKYFDDWGMELRLRNGIPDSLKQGTRKDVPKELCRAVERYYMSRRTGSHEC